MSYHLKAKEQKRKKRKKQQQRSYHFLKVCSNLQVKGAVSYFYFEVFLIGKKMCS